MNWIKYYVPPDANSWQGRHDADPISCFFQTIKMLNLKKDAIKAKKALTFAFLGFCSDTGIKRNFGRPGAHEGPKYLRAALAPLCLPSQDFLCFDAGDIVCLDHDLEAAQNAFADAIATLLAHQFIPIGLGGGHEIAWGHFQGMLKANAEKKIGIVNFDAHLDMRPLLSDHKGSSGTPFLQIAKACDASNRSFNYNCIGLQAAANSTQLMETAKHYHVNMITADDLHQDRSQIAKALLDKSIHHNDYLYVSLCLDVFAQSFAPGVSAPQALGLLPWHVVPLIKQLAESGKVIAYDIAELSPQHDLDNRTAKLAALMIYQIMKAHSKGNRHD